MENPESSPSTDPILFPQGSPTDEEIRLRALNHTKDRLMSIVGHDIRSAIGGVLTLTGMLDKSLEAKDLREARRLNGLIRRSTRDAEELLRDLLAWTRSSCQDLEFKLEPLDVLELVETEVERLRAVAQKKQTGTSGESGSGFGLLLCEDFIQRHGGHLTWESKPGKGSTFSFTIPELIG